MMDSEELKSCRYCKSVKVFGPGAKRCKQCCCDFQRRRREADLKAPNALRTCSKCHATKQVREFILGGKRCKLCHANSRNIDRLKRPEQYLYDVLNPEQSEMDFL